MAATGFTPISLYYSTTASAVPLAANLANGELALNTADMKLYAKNSSGVVTLLAANSGATGTVSSVSVVSANGLAGTVANATTTPAITLSTSVTGVLKGNGTAISAAVSGTDYAPATSGSAILYGNGAGGFSNVTIGSGVSFAGGTLSATGTGGTVTSVAVSGGTTGLTTSGGPITTSGTITLAGTLATTNGGTGLTSFTANGVVYASSTSALTTGSALTFDGTNLGVLSAGLNVGDGTTTLRSVASGGVGLFGTSTNHPLAFRQNNTEGMRLTSTGLGIGTSSPSYKLHVVDNGNINATSAISNSTAGTSSVARFLAISDAGSAVFAMTSSSYTDISGAQDAMLLNANNASGGIAFALDGTLKMKLDSAGNLGLGVTPSAWGSGYRALDINTYGGVLATTSEVDVLGNLYYNGSSWVAKTTGLGTRYLQTSGIHYWQNSASVSAGATATLSTKMTLDSTGNLGLGVTPSAWGLSGQKVFQVLNASLTAYTTDEATITGNGYHNGSGWRYIASNYAEQYSQQGGKHMWFNAASGTAGNAISFTQAMTLSAAGYLGIGDTAPTAILSMFSSNQPAHKYTGAASGFAWGQYNSSGDASLNNTANANLTFCTNNTERARISSTGGFSVGTTANPGAGAIYATGAITAFYSDARLKTVSGKIEDALDKVSKLSGVYYTNNDTAKSFGYTSDEVQVGVLAQEIEAVLPQVVKAAPFDLDENGNSKSGQNYKTVQYEKLVPLLIEAINELRAEVTALKGTI